MSTPLHSVRFPGESREYRDARDALLEEELELRRSLERVAAMRRKLPIGGLIPKDYVFDEIGANGDARRPRLSELFAPGTTSLVVYSFMYGPDAERPCPMCTSFLDGLDGSVPHITQRASLAVVAKSPIGRIREWAQSRGWQNLRFLSSHGNTYNADYFAELSHGGQLPACNVFVRDDGGIRHFYSAEMLYVPVEGHTRHVDLLWPIWSFFDLTPEGRENWMPRLVYDGHGR
ncbi:MAG: hypothetical protein QOD06_2310 [Candidatus Binatota bacterium]|nr:hypothetical protein [Candidatus Binatota bacterium]